MHLAQFSCYVKVSFFWVMVVVPAPLSCVPHAQANVAGAGCRYYCGQPALPSRQHYCCGYKCYHRTSLISSVLSPRQRCSCSHPFARTVRTAVSVRGQTTQITSSFLPKLSRKDCSPKRVKGATSQVTITGGHFE